MAHYSIQITLAELEDRCKDVFDGVSWTKAWQVVSGDQFIGQYANGQAVISGPLIIGNPNKPWFEVQCSTPEVLDDIGANVTELMKTRLRTDALMRAAYRVEVAREGSGRSLILNGAGKPIGVRPKFEICGHGGIGSFLIDEALEEAAELLDLE